ncbi:MAG: restriction endonuclease subunit S [Patescibacteria group bacterium]
MVTDTVIKKGYKQTELGLIPEDWEVKNIEDLTPPGKKFGIVDGPFGSNLKTIHYRKSGIPIITSGYVTDGKFFAPEYLYVDIEKFKQERRSAVRGGDIVMAKIGERCGASAILPKDHSESILSGNALKISIDENKFSTELIAQILWRHHTIGNLELLRTIGAQPAISMANLKKYKIPIPATKLEQTAIATVFSDTDALIEHLEELITKKKAIKQGTMQILLTGKKRLPGFTGKWEEKILKKMIQIPVTDGPHLTPRFLQEGIPFLSVNNLNNNKIDYSDLRYISRKDHEEFSKKCKPQKNDILLGKAASVGLVALVETDLEFNIWSPIALIRLNKEYIPKFVYYLFSTKATSDQIKLLTNSSSQGNIGMCDIEKLNFLVPSKEEQAGIATIFSDMDTEIENLEQKRDKYIMIKKGMMQQLLTGKIRIYGNN